MEKKKLVHLELLRIIAIYWVIFNHTEEDGFTLFTISPNSPTHEIYLFISIGCKFAVPLFFMISGAVLLNKEESIGTVYKKRILRLLITLIAITFFYEIYYNGTFKPVRFFKTLYSSEAAVALWYIYSYIAMLMMLPLLRKMAQNMSFNEFVYMAVMSIVFIGIIPIVQYRLGLDKVTINSNIKPELFTAAQVNT